MHPILQTYFATIKQFLPDQKQEFAVGLDVGSGYCKLVEIAKTDKSYKLLNWAIEPVNNGDTNAAIKKILTTVELPKIVYTSVFGKGTLIRYIDMPRMPLDELKNSFSIEADKYFPFAQDQIYTDCYILDPQGKTKQMPVLAAAAKKDLVDQRVKLLTDLGIQVNFLGLNPIALANVIHVLGISNDIKSDGAVALLDMGETVSNLIILVNRLPRFTRDIFIGGRDFTKRISNTLGVSVQEAEKLKVQPGARLPEVLNACEASVMNLVQEIRLSFDYFVTEKNVEITQLLLTGGASRLEGISTVFEKNLELKISPWNPLSPLEIAPEVAREDLHIKSFKLGVALGLALYKYD